jgi:hypothetical protein
MYCPKVLRHRLWGAAVMVCLTLILNACGGGGGGSGPTSTSPLISNSNPIIGAAISGNNVMTVTVDSGPAGSYYLVNRLFASVKICLPGTQTCQTLDHVLVDTGSTGLRVIYSALNPAMQNGIAPINSNAGGTLFNCVKFLDGSFAWGPVAIADVTLGSKAASNLPIQVIADSHYAGLSSNCSTGGSEITSVNGSNSIDPSALGATGILGISHLRQDCGTDCANSLGWGVYFRCIISDCTIANPSAAAFPSTAVNSSTATLSQQVSNPVPLFGPPDNKGFVVILPGITPSGAGQVASMQGSIVFGIDTQANNSSAGSTLLQLNQTNYGDFITTAFNGTTMAGSFLDTGSNGLYFDNNPAGVTDCSNNSGASGFYCTNGFNIVSSSATLTGTNGVPKTVSFSVSTPSFENGYSVYPMLAGPLGQSGTFDWGLPFFYGRSVFIGIEGMTSNLGTGPYYGL